MLTGLTSVSPDFVRCRAASRTIFWSFSFVVHSHMVAMQTTHRLIYRKLVARGHRVTLLCGGWVGGWGRRLPGRVCPRSVCGHPRCAGRYKSGDSRLTDDIRGCSAPALTRPTPAMRRWSGHLSRPAGLAGLAALLIGRSGDSIMLKLATEVYKFHQT